MTEETQMSKYLVAPLDGDLGTPYLGSSPNNTDFGTAVATFAGVGNSYWAFTSLPSAILLANDIGADFTGTPICNTVENAQNNSDAVAELYENPPQVGEIKGVGNKVWGVD